MTIQELIENIILSEGHLWVKESQLKKNMIRRRMSPDIPSSVENIRKIIVDNVVYYSLLKYDMWETYAAYDAIRILRNYNIPSISDILLNSYITAGENALNIKLHEQQRAAVVCAILNGIAVITGGPGTGKTSVLKVLKYVLRQIRYDIDIRFTAPTGKAARRITESTGNFAKTVQKELGITYTNDNKSMFGGDVLIIDEISMLDMETAYYTFRAIKNGQKIILVGDIDQLPSVGPGAVLRDLLFSEVIPKVELTKTFRQANDSNLFANILRIRESEWTMTEGNDFEIIHTPKIRDDEECLNQLVAMFLKEYQQFGIENVACLLPYRKAGLLCSDYVNNILQSHVNKIGQKPYFTSKTEAGLKVNFTIGDPVMQLENRAECANGDIGFVQKINHGFMYVDYVDCTVRYTQKELQQLSLAYSMSINKSQGSEYLSVVMGITTAHTNMLNKNLLYTGITRAKKHVALLQEDVAMQIAINNEVTYKRLTMMAEKLKFYYRKEMLGAI